MDFDILGNVIKSSTVVTMLSIVGYSYLLFPFLTLFVWVGYLMRDAEQEYGDLDYDNYIYVGAWSVLLIGISLFLIVIAMTKISWNNYRFKGVHMILILVAYISFTAWQFMVMFSSIKDDFSFQGMTTVFLTQSGMCMIFLIYLNLYENKFNLIYFLNKFMAKGDPDDKPNPLRTNDILEEVQE